MDDPSEMPARLAAFLAAEEPSWSEIEVAEYEVMTGGYSRLLARAVVRHADGEHVFVLRGDPPPDRALIDTDREQEWQVLRTVAPRVRTPAARYFDPTGEQLGTRAVVLDFSRSTSFLVHSAAGGDLTGLSERLADAMASYHSIPIEDLPARLERPLDWDAYLTGRIDEWRRTAEAHVEALPILRYVAGWLDAHRPEPVPLTLIHGDFQSANLMLAPDGHFEILDWELASIGDPREDMGYFKAVAQAAPPDLLDEAGSLAFCERYRSLTGLSELQVNPMTIAYFLVLGVIGTVRRILETGAGFATGSNRSLNGVFNLSSVLFGQSVWLPTTAALGPILDQLTEAG